RGATPRRAILLIVSSLPSEKTPNSALMSSLVHSRRSKMDLLTISLAIRALSPYLLYSNTLVTSVLQLFFQSVSGLQKLLGFEPQIVDAIAANLATFVRRFDEFAVDVGKRVSQLNPRVMKPQLGVRLRRSAVVLPVVADIADAFNLAPVLPDFSLDLALILVDAVATSH